MNDITFFPIAKRQLIYEIAEEVASRLIPLLQPQVQEDELIQIPEAMRLLGRSRTTINNWRWDGFLNEQVINTRVYFKKSDIRNAGHQKNGRKK